ncbi:MAG: hypothetical protein RR921_07545 [Mucinivorans sp.]
MWISPQHMPLHPILELIYFDTDKMLVGFKWQTERCGMAMELFYSLAFTIAI